MTGNAPTDCKTPAPPASPAHPLLARIQQYLRDGAYTLPLPAVLLLDEAADALAQAPPIDRPGVWHVDRTFDNPRWTATRLSDAWNPGLDLDDGR